MLGESLRELIYHNLKIVLYFLIDMSFNFLFLVIFLQIVVSDQLIVSGLELFDPDEKILVYLF